MNIKEVIGTTIAAITLMGIGYTAALRGGYVVDEAKASEIAQQKVDKEELARLEFMRDVKFSRLRLLNGIENKTPDDQLEIEVLRDEIKRINDRLEQLK